MECDTPPYSKLVQQTMSILGDMGRKRRVLHRQHWACVEVVNVLIEPGASELSRQRPKEHRARGKIKLLSLEMHCAPRCQQEHQPARSTPDHSERAPIPSGVQTE
eukprot:1686425-Amphidinium_carterae.1